MFVTIDRFEGDKVILETENREIISVPKELLQNAKEGDVIKIKIDRFETKRRKKRIQRLMRELWYD